MRNRVLSAVVLSCFLSVSLATADVTLTQRKAARAERKAERMAAKAARPPKEDVQALATTARRRARAERANSTQATGSIGLIDSSGLQWFMNTNITTSETFSASAAMSEASYTTSVTATTSGGLTTTSTLNDAYDGYQAMCVSFTGQTGPCVTPGGPARAPVRERGEGVLNPYIFYNQTGGPPTPDGSCGNRQYIFPLMTVNGLQMYRKVFVPSTDSFARWLNIFTNTTGAPKTFNMITSNNLGSDSYTKIVTSTNGDAVADLTDTWITSFQNFNGSNTSSDVRLGHVFQGPGGALGLSNIFFADGSDLPFWTYTITLAPGETKIIMNFGVGQPTNALAAAKAAQLASLTNSNATSCMSAIEMSQVANFSVQQVSVPAVGPIGLALLGLGLAVLGFVVVRRLS